MYCITRRITAMSKQCIEKKNLFQVAIIYFRNDNLDDRPHIVEVRRSLYSTCKIFCILQCHLFVFEMKRETKAMHHWQCLVSGQINSVKEIRKTKA